MSLLFLRLPQSQLRFISRLGIGISESLYVNVYTRVTCFSYEDAETSVIRMRLRESLHR